MNKLIKRTIISIIITILSSQIAKRLKARILNYYPNLKIYITQEKKDVINQRGGSELSKFEKILLYIIKDMEVKAAITTALALFINNCLNEEISLLLSTLKTLPQKEIKRLIKNNFLKLSKKTLKQITETDIDDLVNVTFSDLPLDDRVHLLSIKLKGLFYGLTKRQAILLLIILIILAIFLRFNNCEAYFALCAALSAIFKSSTIKELILDSNKFKGFINLANYDDKFPDNLFEDIKKPTESEIPIQITLETFFEGIIINEEN